jgi:hypothetical protein
LLMLVKDAIFQVAFSLKNSLRKVNSKKQFMLQKCRLKMEPKFLISISMMV